MNEEVQGLEDNPLNQTTSSTKVTLNELRVHMGFGETRVPKIKVRNVGEEMKRLFKTIPWYEYEINAYAHKERVAKLSMKCMQGSLETTRDERCMDLTVDPYTLEYGPKEEANVLNDNLPRCRIILQNTMACFHTHSGLQATSSTNRACTTCDRPCKARWNARCNSRPRKGYTHPLSAHPCPLLGRAQARPPAGA